MEMVMRTITISTTSFETIRDLLETEITTTEEMRPADEEEAAQRDAFLSILRAALSDLTKGE
jgi:hypothetical protein